MADIFDLLADDTRRELLTTLHGARVRGVPNGELSVSELVEKLALSQPTVSKHLQKLREHGLVAVRTDGQHHFYRLDAAPLRAVESWVTELLETVENEPAGITTPFSAWSGSDLGDSLGRRLADGTHQARVAAADVQVKVAKRLPKIVKRKAVDGE